MTMGKIIALTTWTFVGKVMSLLFNMLSRLIIVFLPRCKCVLILWLQSPSAVILEPPQIKSDTVSTVSPSIFHEVVYIYIYIHTHTHTDTHTHTHTHVLASMKIGKVCTKVFNEMLSCFALVEDELIMHQWNHICSAYLYPQILLLDFKFRD